MERAIRKAIEGGWEDQWTAYESVPKYMYYGAIIRDRLFWQALGKVEEWGSFYDKKGMPRNYNTRGWYPDTSNTNSSGTDEKMWQAHWHCFVDHLVEGKDINSFFEKLLGKE